MKSKSIFRSATVALLLLLTAQPILGQTSFKIDPKKTTFIDNAVMECIYKHTVNAPLKNNKKQTAKEVSTTILQANTRFSKFWDWHAYKIDSVNYSYSEAELQTPRVKNAIELYRGVKYFFIPEIIKNFPEGKMTVADEIIPVDYVYEEKKTNREWVLKEDTMTVCGYLCNKAVTSFGGKEWTAWYTPEIAISDGPWKLYGLPGLILKAKDSTDTHLFEAVNIRKSGTPIYAKKNSSQIKIKKNAFLKNKNSSDQRSSYYNTGTHEVEVGKGGAMFYDGKRDQSFNGTKYCPLELE